MLRAAAAVVHRRAAELLNEGRSSGLICHRNLLEDRGNVRRIWRDSKGRQVKNMALNGHTLDS